MNTDQLAGDLAVAFECDLQHFTGTEQYHRLNMSQMVCTDGVKYFADHAGGGAYWFVDFVSFEVFGRIKAEGFMFIKLLVHANATADIIVTNGDGQILFQKRIGFTDCYEGEWNFYLIDNVMLLPTEY